MIAEEKNQRLMDRVEDIEKFKDDAGKMFQAVRTAISMKDKKELLIDTGRGVTTDEGRQVHLITEFFQDYFTSEKAEEAGINITPEPMNKPFTSEEILKAISKLKNNKSPGIDKLNGELLKYGPDSVAEIIAELLNTAAETGNHPLEINTGILTPLQKPGKARGPCSNLRPIILLSILRKILAITLMDRVADRILQHVPHSQSAYQKDRSTTEQIFAFKILAEKAITSEDYHANILLMDMSKAFDTVDRKTLLEDLKRIVNPDELHMIKILLDEVKLAVRVGKTTGELFQTNVGVPQGDCLSPILFILYLAKAPEFEPAMQDHLYTKPSHMGEKTPSEVLEHNYGISKEEIYRRQKESLTIPAQYADDCGSITISKYPEVMEYQKQMMPGMLAKRNLSCNETKTEEYSVCRKGDTGYKKM